MDLLTQGPQLRFYGTLIDWEAGIAAVLGPWAREARARPRRRAAPGRLRRPRGGGRARPLPRGIPTCSPRRSATREALGRPVDDAWSRRLGDSVPDWPASPDSAGALASLAAHYRLIIVSNVHRVGFAASNRRLRGRCRPVITAEDVGAYKPAGNHFQGLVPTLDDLGVAPASSSTSPRASSTTMSRPTGGIRSVWINRRHDRPGWGATPEPSETWTYDLEFPPWPPSPPRPPPRSDVF